MQFEDPARSAPLPGSRETGGRTVRGLTEGYTAVNVEVAPHQGVKARGDLGAQIYLFCPLGRVAKPSGAAPLGAESHISERLSLKHPGEKVKYEINYSNIKLLQ